MMFQMKQNEAIPLEWSGDILLTRPQTFSREEYEKYFDQNMISYDILTDYMNQPPFSIFHNIPVWVLKDEYIQEIKNDILSGRQESENGLKWQMDFLATSTNGDYWGFGELSQQNKERIINWMLKPKKGLCQGTTIGNVEMNYIVHVSEPFVPSNNTRGYFGTVRLDCSPKPQECEYIYDTISGGAVLMHRLQSDFLEDCYFEDSLPPKIDEYCNDIKDIVEQACEIFQNREYQRQEGGAALDDVINECEDTARIQNLLSENKNIISYDDWEL